MRVPLLFGLLTFLLAAPALAEEKEPTTSSIGEVQARLANDDPAEQAWGCYLAGRDGHKDVVPQIVDVLHKHTEEPDKIWRAVHRSALDALIRLDARPSDTTLRALDRHNAIQVLILRSRDPAAHAAALTERLNGALRGKTIGHYGLATGNLLVGIRAKGIPLRLLNRLEARLTVTVYTPKPGFGGRGGSRDLGFGSGDGSARIPEGFPPYVWYQLSTRTDRGFVLLADGPRPVYVERRERATRGLAVGGSSLRLARMEACLEWLGAMLEVRPEEFGFREKASVSVGWTSADAYIDRVTRNRQAILDPWWALVRRLVDAHRIAREDAYAYEPTLTVEIKDTREDKADPIPELPAATRPAWAVAPAPPEDSAR